jgi:hypothetical protein
MEFLPPESIDQLFQFALIISGRRSVALELMAETISEVEARASQWREQSHILQWALRWCWVQSQRQPAPDPSESDLASEMEAFLGCEQRAERAARGLICMKIFEPSGIARVLGLRVAEVKKLSIQVESQFGSDQHLEMRLKDCLSMMSINSLERHLLGSAVRSWRIRGAHRCPRFSWMVRMGTMDGKRAGPSSGLYGGACCLKRTLDRGRPQDL